MKHMTILATVLIIALVSPLSVFGQSQSPTRQPLPTSELVTQADEGCNLSLAQSPELRGYRLGMSVEQVQARVPGAGFAKDWPLNRQAIVLRPRPPSDRMLDGLRVRNYSDAALIDNSVFPGYEGVREISLYFTNGQLSTIEGSYENNQRWESVNQFMEAAASGLNLPGRWSPLQERAVADRYRIVSRTLKCSGFEVTTSMSLRVSPYGLSPFNTSVKISNVAIEEAERQKKIDAERREKEKQRETFKP